MNLGSYLFVGKGCLKYIVAIKLLIRILLIFAILPPIKMLLILNYGLNIVPPINKTI